MKNKLKLFPKIYKIIFTLILFCMLGSNNFSSQYKLSKNVMSELNVRSNDEKILVWIEFVDKGTNVDFELSHPELYLTQRSIERRMKVKPLNHLVDFSDIPLSQDYVTRLRNSGIEIKNKSKWFNRISCFATKVQLEQLVDNDFIKKVDLVMKMKKNPDDVELNNTEEVKDNSGSQNNIFSLNYGASFEQMQLINVPTAQDSGYKGQGVLIASFDAGFDNLQHPVFDSIKSRGLRTYDFVDHDTIVANYPGHMGEGSHGTKTLSLVGGFSSGNLISPAFRSNFILAKTENTDSETPLEEDNWIAASEWADSLGADIITSSLGYIAMDGGSKHSYDWTWMNGDSCEITIGADLAVDKGILVCNSAGNEGFDPVHNTLGAPSDGDSVICVGSCNLNKQRSGFSSVGLTTDGRIKPDVVALGSGNVVAESGAGSTGYTSGSGTSFSCPMTAGACAVILSANHNLTPRQVWQVLKQTADSSSTPNRLRGWGLVNCWEALKIGRTLTTMINNNNLIAEGYSLSQNYPNPFNPSTVINYSISLKNYITIKVYNISGKEISTLINQYQNPGSYSVKFDGANLSSGIYFYTLSIEGSLITTRKMLLVK